MRKDIGTSPSIIAMHYLSIWQQQDSIWSIAVVHLYVTLGISMEKKILCFNKSWLFGIVDLFCKPHFRHASPRRSVIARTRISVA